VGLSYFKNNTILYDQNGGNTQGDIMSKIEKGWKNKAVWTLMVLLGLAFLMSGGMKLTGPEAMVANFARWGYPAWFLYFIGLVEVVGAISLFVPRLTAYVAAELGGIMVGATITHLMFDPPAHAGAPAMLLGLLFVVGWARRPDFLRKRDELKASRQSV
jgi:putative oxidoreductase